MVKLNRIRDLLRFNTIEYIYTNDNKYVMVLDGNTYILDTNKNVLIKDVNCLNDNIKDIKITDKIKDYIINMCLDDLPF